MGFFERLVCVSIRLAHSILRPFVETIFKGAGTVECVLWKAKSGVKVRCEPNDGHRRTRCVSLPTRYRNRMIEFQGILLNIFTRPLSMNVKSGVKVSEPADGHRRT